MKHIKALLLIVLVLFVVIVAVQNISNLKTPIVFSIDLGFGMKKQTPEIPLASVAVITFLVGAICMGLYGIIERFRLKREIKTLLGEVRERENELNALRKLPETTEVVSSGTFDTE